MVRIYVAEKQEAAEKYYNNIMNTGYLTGTVQWSDETPFNGFAVLRLVPPRNVGGELWDALYQNTTKIPTRTVIPIVDGEFDSDIKLIYNTDISPQNNKYIIYYYSSNGVLVGEPDDITDAFLVDAASVTPPIYINETADSAISLPTDTV